MSKYFNALVKELPLEFGSEKMKSDDLKILLTVELLAVGCQLIDEDLEIRDSWVLFTGYNEPILPATTNFVVVANIRKYLLHATGKTNVQRLLQHYFLIARKFRLLDEDEEGNVVFQTPLFDVDRKQRLVDFLCSPANLTRKKRSFLSSGPFEYERMIHDEKQKFTGNIPAEWIDSPRALPKYKEKKIIPLEKSLIDIAIEMDEIDPTGNWVEKVKPIELTSLQGASTFSFEGLQHIAGGLASGKSTFQIVSTFSLIKHQGAKVGIIENNVQSVLNAVENYERLGLKAIAFIGKSERLKHQEQRLRAHHFSSFEEIANAHTFEQVSDVCLIKALANDMNDTKQQFYPCNIMTKKGSSTRKLCPLSHKCGVYQKWADLAAADIWITTSAAVLQTKMPKMIDAEERLIYELMYDLLDIVFVDEADEVQQQFDNLFLSELNMFGDEHQLLEALIDDIHQLTKAKYELATNKIVTNWRRVTAQVDDVIWYFYEILNNSYDMRAYWKNRIIYLNYLIYDVSSDLIKEDEELKKMQDELRSFANQPILSKSLTSFEELEVFIDQPLRIENDEEIDRWLAGKGIQKDDIKNIEQFYAKFKIFILLSYIERAMTYFVHSYPLLPESIKGEIQFPYLQKHEAFRPYLEEAMTGVMYGYRYVKNEGEQTGKIKLIQYTAIGRKLLYKWPSLYAYAKGKKGPAVVLLSGTSYAPKSMHYHIEQVPNWLIQSSRQTSRLQQFMLTLYDPLKDEEPIKVSGMGIGPEREKNLYRLTIELNSKIEDELIYWQKKGGNRRVLLVVNSYEDAKIVGKALEQQSKWKNDYRILTRDEQANDRTYSRPLIERYSEAKERILIVPLLSVGRGYNIMDEHEEGALFGTVFFLIRPYPIPNDLSYYVQVLHGKLPSFLKEIEKEQIQYGEAMQRIRGKSRQLLLKMFSYPDFWKRLSEEERLILAWYTFIPVWQMIGRLLRGGKDANVYYCDAKFHQKTADVPSLLDYWMNIMSDNEDETFNSLYGPFKESILNIIDEGMVL